MLHACTRLHRHGRATVMKSASCKTLFRKQHSLVAQALPLRLRRLHNEVTVDLDQRRRRRGVPFELLCPELLHAHMPALLRHVFPSSQPSQPCQSLHHEPLVFPPCLILTRLICGNRLDRLRLRLLGGLGGLCVLHLIVCLRGSILYHPKSLPSQL